MRRSVSEKKRKRIAAIERAAGLTMQDAAYNAMTRLSVDELAAVEVWALAVADSGAALRRVDLDQDQGP